MKLHNKVRRGYGLDALCYVFGQHRRDKHLARLPSFMGMFDWYRPSGEFQCPVCGIALNEWQGKDSLCALVVWMQGASSPISQLADEEIQMPEEIRRAWRLPERFEIYSYDCGKHRVIAQGRTEGGVWSETLVISAAEIGKRI